MLISSLSWLLPFGKCLGQEDTLKTREELLQMIKSNNTLFEGKAARDQIRKGLVWQILQTVWWQCFLRLCWWPHLLNLSLFEFAFNMTTWDYVFHMFSMWVLEALLAPYRLSSVTNTTIDMHLFHSCFNIQNIQCLYIRLLFLCVLGHSSSGAKHKGRSQFKHETNTNWSMKRVFSDGLFSNRWISLWLIWVLESGNVGSQLWSNGILNGSKWYTKRQHHYPQFIRWQRFNNVCSYWRPWRLAGVVPVTGRWVDNRLIVDW